MIRRIQFGQRSSIGIAAGLSSLYSLAVSVVAIQAFDLAAFGAFAICFTSAQFVAAVMRASIGETALGSSSDDAALGSLLVFIAPLLAAVVGGVLLAVQLFVADVSFELFVPGIVLASVLSAAEVGKIRVISLRQAKSLVFYEAGRLVLLVGMVLLLDVATVSDSLWVAAAPTFAFACLTLRGGRGGIARVGIRPGLLAGLDVFTQRSAGQVVTMMLAASSGLVVVGGISALRLSFAPVTTIYSSAASLALTGSRGDRSYVSLVIRSLVAVGVLYTLALFALVVSDSSLATVFGQEILGLASAIPAVGIFVVGSAGAPFLSTSLRRVGRPDLSLRSRVASSVGFVSAVAFALFVLGAATTTSVAWAFGVSGIISFVAWWTGYRALSKVVDLD